MLVTDLLDKQHKQLHEMCQQALMHIDDESSEGTELFHSLLNDLVFFTAEHFNTEEFVLSSLNYPLFDDHKQKHDEFQERLTELLYSAAIGTAEKTDLMQFLKDWWEQHTMKTI